MAECARRGSHRILSNISSRAVACVHRLWTIYHEAHAEHSTGELTQPPPLAPLVRNQWYPAIAHTAPVDACPALLGSLLASSSRHRHLNSDTKCSTLQLNRHRPQPTSYNHEGLHDPAASDHLTFTHLRHQISVSWDPPLGEDHGVTRRAYCEIQGLRSRTAGVGYCPACFC